MMDGLHMRLTGLHRKLRLTQVEAGRLIGISSSLISAFEIGSRVPPPDTIVEYAARFHVTTDYLSDVFIFPKV